MNNCTNCKYFDSYAYIYEDDLEDIYLGICNCVKSLLYKEQVGEDDICINFEIIDEKFGK